MWDIDESYRSDKAALGWARHDACTVLRLKGQAQGAGGQVGPDHQISRFPRHIAAGPFVGSPGFTNRVARLMRLCGSILSQNEAYEDHVWYSDGMSLYCAQSAGDARITAYLSGRSPDDWKQMRESTRLICP